MTQILVHLVKLFLSIQDNDIVIPIAVLEEIWNGFSSLLIHKI